MNKIHYKEIAEYINKSEGTIKNWKKNHPELLELVKLGAFCKKNNITIEQVEKCIDLKESIKENKWE